MGCSGVFTVGKALFTTNERIRSSTKEDLRVTNIGYMIVRMYYFLTLHDTFLIL